MRKNTQQVFNAWRAGKSYRARGRNGSPIWTDGVRVYSYATPIVAPGESGSDAVRFNANRYSVTTSCQQGGLRALLARQGIAFVELDEAFMR